MNISLLLRILALICFVFAMFGFNPFTVAMLPTALALWCGSTMA